MCRGRGDGGVQDHLAPFVLLLASRECHLPVCPGGERKIATLLSRIVSREYRGWSLVSKRMSR